MWIATLIGAVLGVISGGAVAGVWGAVFGVAFGAFVGFSLGVWLAEPPATLRTEDVRFPCAGVGRDVDARIVVDDDGRVSDVIECTAFHPSRDVQCTKACRTLLTDTGVERWRKAG